METQELRAAMERLARIEGQSRRLARQNRRLWTVGGTALAVVGALVLGGAATPRQTDYRDSDFYFRTVKADGFSLVGENDKRRVLLSVFAGDPVLHFLDHRGKNRPVMGLHKDVPSLTVRNTAVSRASLELSRDKPGLYLWADVQRLPCAALGISKHGEPVVEICGEDDSVVWKVP